MKVPGGGEIDIEHESAPGAAQAEDAIQRFTRLSDETRDTAFVVLSSVTIPDGGGGPRPAIVARLVPGRVFGDSGELAWSATAGAAERVPGEPQVRLLAPGRERLLPPAVGQRPRQRHLRALRRWSPT